MYYYFENKKRNFNSFRNTKDCKFQCSKDTGDASCSTGCITHISTSEEGTRYDGNYWHFAEDGETPIVWTK